MWPSARFLRCQIRLSWVCFILLRHPKTTTYLRKTERLLNVSAFALRIDRSAPFTANLWKLCFEKCRCLVESTARDQPSSRYMSSEPTTRFTQARTDNPYQFHSSEQTCCFVNFTSRTRHQALLRAQQYGAEAHGCGCGEIGRRTRFRFWRRKAWGFKSLHPHQI